MKTEKRTKALDILIGEMQEFDYLAQAVYHVGVMLQEEQEANVALESTRFALMKHIFEVCGEEIQRPTCTQERDISLYHIMVKVLEL